ncbi:M15 family metallopeptidase [Cryobacterium lactosi]|nr:M15 family metallopeptidase [Cryobacterium lactosi]
MLVIALTLIVVALVGVVGLYLVLVAPLGPDDSLVGPDSEVVTAFDDDNPTVAKLEPQLRDALQRSAADAEKDDVFFQVNSGWRSAEEQERLRSDGVAEYGSVEEASRWVATAETSPHVSGDAVDVGSFDAVVWLSEHGARYGLCQIYDNEAWHFEYRPDAITSGCPPKYFDPTEDPRMQP